MKKINILFLFVIFLFQTISFSQNKSSVEIKTFFEPMDAKGWQFFFITDTFKRRFPDIKTEINPIISMKDNSFFSPRGEVEVLEVERMMFIKEKYPEKLFSYLNARALSPMPEGWVEASVFAGINPIEIKDFIEKNKEKLLKDAYENSQKYKVNEASIFINNKKYEGDLRLISILEAFNKALPNNKKINLYKGEMKNFKGPKFEIILSNKTKDLVNEKIVDIFKRYFSNLEVKTINLDTDKKYVGEFKFLPAYLIEDNNSVRESLAQPINAGMFEKIKDYYVFYDKNSKLFIQNVKETPNKLELYVMPQCPFGVMAENAIIKAYKEGLISKNTKIEIHYIAEVQKDANGKLTFNSLHGEDEVNEAIRQAYIAKKYPNKFYEYLLERNKDYRNINWQDSAKKVGLNVNDIEKNIKEGEQILAEDLKKANSLGINTSPSFVVNSNILLVGINELIKLPDYKKVNINEKASGGCGK